MKLLSLIAGLCVLSFATVSMADEKDGAAKKVPDVYKVKFETSCGDFVIEVNREWAPVGADRFHELVEMGFTTTADSSASFRTSWCSLASTAIRRFRRIGETRVFETIVFENRTSVATSHSRLPARIRGRLRSSSISRTTVSLTARALHHSEKLSKGWMSLTRSTPVMVKNLTREPSSRKGMSICRPSSQSWTTSRRQRS